MASLRTTRVSLIARVGATPSDPRAWSDFVSFYSPAIFGWCREYGLQDRDAQEVTQDVIVRFWRHAAAFQYDPTRRFRSYLRRIVLTTVADWARTKSDDLAAGGDPMLESLFENLPAREDLVASIEQAFDLERLSQVMKEVEKRVKPTTWAAFRMLAIERLPGKVVAERLGISPANAYMARMNVQRMISDTLRRREVAATTA